MNAARLARSFDRGQSEVAATYPDEARRYNEGYYRNDDGTIAFDGKAAAIVAREPLVLAEGKLGGITRTSWTVLGPELLGGRIRSLAFDVADPARIYVGAATGGVWFSTDTGTTWTPVNDFSASLSISSLSQARSEPNTIYASTGELPGGFAGVGLLKSTDRGVTWQALASTSPAGNGNWRFVQSVAVDPTNSSHVIAGNLCGLFRSVNAGTSWTNIFAMVSGGYCGVGHRVVFSPANSSLIIAGMTGRAIGRSTDGGATFTRIQLGTAPAENYSWKVDVAVSASQPAVWYASVNENSGDVYRSNDSGATWTKTSNPKHLGNQGDWGNVIWVDPTTPNVVVVGGIDLYRSADGGVTWTKISDWVSGYRSGGTAAVSAHADHHAIVASPGYNGTTNRIVFFGTDGGIYRNSDIQSAATLTGWASLNAGMVTTQFYAASAKVYPGGLAVAGGLQDNSVNFLAAGATSWRQPTTGDGTGAFFDFNDPTRLTMSTQNLGLWRHNLTTGSLQLICQNITEAGTFCKSTNVQKANFIAPFVVDPTNPERVLAGAASLWLSVNARTATPPTWTVVKAASTTLINGQPRNYINAVTQRLDQPQVVFVGHENGEIHSTNDVYALTPVWTRRDVTGMPARRVNRVLIDPARPSRVFAVYSGTQAGNIWTSDDGGTTWRALATNLPSTPVYSLAIRPSDGNVLYAGTDVGLFVSTNAGAAWATTNDGPSGASVRDLAFADTNTIVVATHGRGAWKGTLTPGDTVFALTVSKAGPGSGTVVSSPAVFNCGSTCSANFNAGASVSLAAAAATGSTFAGWSGACSGTGPCTVTMDAAKSVTATFNLGAGFGYVLTVAKSGTGGGTVTSAPAGVDCGSTCSATFASGTAVTLTAAPAAGSSFAGWSGGTCTGTGLCTVSITTALSVAAAFNTTGTTPALSASPTSISFGGQSMKTTSPAQTVTISNAGGAALTISSLAASTNFGVSHTCGTGLAANASCTASVTFTPGVEGALSGFLTITSGSGTQVVALAGSGEKSLVTHYYRSILRRAPDAGGKAYWDAEAVRVQALGANVNEVWFALAQQFYFSSEYTAQNRDNAGFVTDLYNTFFNRGPDTAGRDYWVGLIVSGLPREVVLLGFMFSAEFTSFTQAIFGATTVRREVDTVGDFYRGLLARLPDDAGFNYWVGQFRTAQCQGGSQVNAQVEAISSAYANSAEYAGRNRSNTQYVSDLYNSFLRRAGDLPGVQYWISQIATSARTRENVRQQFIATPEFQARVQAIIAAGCKT